MLIRLWLLVTATAPDPAAHAPAAPAASILCGCPGGEISLCQLLASKLLG